MVVSTSPRTRLEPWHQPYGSTKSFLESFVVSSAPQLSRYGVRINAVLPGGHVNPRGKEEEGARASDVMVPLQIYLASDESVNVTGQILCGEEFLGGPPAE
jgi:NAD(P)-dependent dehydrogenase (short-subunit alcohol dehydrogenase family)